MRIFAPLALAIVLQLLAPQAATATSAYPAASVLESFKQSCRGLTKISEIAARASALGWIAKEPSKDSPLSPMLARWRELAASPDEGASVSLVMQIFSRDISGRALWLVTRDTTSRDEDGTQTEQVCEVYDLAASRENLEAVRTVASGQVKESFSGGADEIATLGIKPTMVSGADEVIIAFTPGDGTYFFAPGLDFQAARRSR